MFLPVDVSLLGPISQPKALQVFVEAWKCIQMMSGRNGSIEKSLYGRNQVIGDLSWRLTGLFFFFFCFSCHGIQFSEPKRWLYSSAPSGEGAIIKPFKFSFVFWRDSDNSPGAKVCFVSLIPGFEQFPFFLSLLRAVVS